MGFDFVTAQLWAWAGVLAALLILPIVLYVPDGPTEKVGFAGLSVVQQDNTLLVVFGVLWNSLFLNAWMNILYSVTLSQLTAALFAIGMCCR